MLLGQQTSLAPGNVRGIRNSSQCVSLLSFLWLSIVYIEYRLLHSDIPAEDGLTARALVTKDRIPKAMEISSDVPQQTGPLATSPGSPALQKLHNLEMSSPEFQDQLFKAFYREEYVECVRDLGGDDPTWLVNYLDMVRLYLLPPWIDTQACAGSQRS